MDIVSSRSNTRVKAVRRLLTPKGRSEAGRTLVEGPRGFGELIDAGILPVLVVRASSDRITASAVVELALDEIVVTDDVLVSVSDTAAPQSPVAVIERPASHVLRRHPTVVLVDIADPGNVGTILRSAGAFGWDAAITPGSADPWAPKALRAAAGATFRLHLSTVTEPVSECSEAGLETIALVADGGALLSPTSTAPAVLVGSESEGLSSGIVQDADHRMTIAMPGGRESLNAGVAASIAMHDLTGPDLAKP